MANIQKLHELLTTPPTKYLVITDRDSKIVLSTTNFYEAVKLANLCRRTGGEVTIFKSTKA